MTLRDAFTGALGDIVAMHVEVPSKICRSTADPAKFRPNNRETADHSLPCCIALAWLDGRVEVDQFERARWQDDDVRSLMQRIHVRPATDLEQRWPNGRPARISIHLSDATSHSVEVGVPLGDAARPMSDTELEAKFVALAQPVVGATRAREIITHVAALEALDDVGELGRLLRG